AADAAPGDRALLQRVAAGRMDRRVSGAAFGEREQLRASRRRREHRAAPLPDAWGDRSVDVPPGESARSRRWPELADHLPRRGAEQVRRASDLSDREPDDGRAGAEDESA